MAIESKNLLVWVKAMSRGQALPLDASEVYSSYAEATTYASSPTAYAGQTIKALMEDGKYHSYTLQPSDAGYILEEVGALKASDLKQFVMVVDELPTDEIKEYVEKKLERIERYFEGAEIDVSVKIKTERAYQIAEMQVSVKGETLRAVTETKDLYASIDKDIDILEGQIRKIKTKKEKMNKDESIRLKESFDGEFRCPYPFVVSAVFQKYGVKIN